jgi:signal peptide peptidase-like protein 2B
MARARPIPFLLASALVIVTTSTAAAATPADVCVGPIVKLSVFAPDDSADAAGAPPSSSSSSSSSATKQPLFSTEYGVLAAFGGLPPNATSPSERKRLRLRLAEPLTACPEEGTNGTAATTSGGADFAGAWALAARGGGNNCSFAAKYDRLVNQLGAAGVLVYDDRPGCVVMGAVPPPAPSPPASPDKPSPPPPAPKPEDEDAEDAPPALSLDHSRGLVLAELVRAVEGAGGVVEVEAWLPELPAALTGGGWGAAASAVALAAMATGTVVWGSLWSGRDKLKELQEEEEEEEEEEGATMTRRRRHGGRRRQQQPPAEQAASPNNPLEVTPAGACWFVIIASASLLAIWCLRGPFIAAALTVAFAAGGAQGVAAWLSPLLRRVATGKQQQRVPEWAATVLELLFGLPPMDDDEVLEQQGGWQALPSSAAAPPPPPQASATPDARPPSHFHYRRADLLSAAIALSTAALWFLADRWGWPAARLSAPLQDLLAVSLLAQLLRALRLPDFKSACALLPLVLLYDVFWVFLQPRLFGGDSVMVDVATGAGGGAGRPLPLLLRVPSPLFGLGAALAEALPGLPASISPGGGDSLLGFGDVVLPGMLAALARRVDVGRRWKHQERRRRDEEEAQDGRVAAAAADYSGPSSSSCLSSSPYLVAVSLAYALGLALTFLALKAGVGGEGGQPALLYLCPCVLSAFGGVAWWRGEMKEVWQGEGGIDDEEEEEEGR